MRTFICDNGLEGFDYVLNAINLAEKSIEIQMFIWRNDPIGQKMGEAVLAAANRGVKIQINKDLLGGVFEYAEESKLSFFHSSLPLFYRINALLLDVMYPMKGKPRGYRQTENRLSEKIRKHENIECNLDKPLYNHSKYYLIDDKQLIISGMNIEFKEWQHDLLGRPYVDFLMGIEDQAIVSGFKRAMTTYQEILPSSYYRDPSIVQKQIHWFTNKYIGKQKDFGMQESILKLLESAQSSIEIIMAYIGDPKINEMLVTKIRQGISVTLFLPGEANLQNDLNRKLALKLWKACEGRIEIYLNPKMIHGKMLCIDRKWLSFGSSNLNSPAMHRLLETNICYPLQQLGQDAFYKTLLDKLISDSTRVVSEKDLHYNAKYAFLEGLIK